EIRERLGDYLNRVALRHDQFIIERKGKPLAAMVPVEKLEELERAARESLLESLRSRKQSPPQSEADRLADEAKHRTRRRKHTSLPFVRAVLDANVFVSGLIRPQGPPGQILVRLLRDGAFELVVSPAILDELRRSLRYTKVRKYLHLEINQIDLW